MPVDLIPIALAAAAPAALAACLAAAVARRRVRALSAAVREQQGVVEAMRERETAYRGAAEEQAALRRVATAVAGHVGPGVVFDLVAEEAARLLDAQVGHVCRFVGLRAMVVGSWGSGALGRDGWFSLYGSAVMANVVEGRSARVDDYGAVSGHDARGIEVVHPSQYGAIAAPVRVSSDLWGVILVVSATSVSSLPHGAEARLGRFAELVTLAIAAAEERDRLRDLATTDPLTGLDNRRGFEARLAAEIERSGRHGHPLSLVLMDIDHFKRVNDTWGHQVGDEVLAEFSRRLKAQSRGSDTVARIGGEEFAWLLPDTPAEGARDAAERARRIVQSAEFPVAGTVTCSAGVADVAIAGCTAVQLLRRADEALYAAKNGGRNATHVATPRGDLIAPWV